MCKVVILVKYTFRIVLISIYLSYMRIFVRTPAWLEAESIYYGNSASFPTLYETFEINRMKQKYSTMLTIILKSLAFQITRERAITSLNPETTLQRSGTINHKFNL